MVFELIDCDLKKLMDKVTLYNINLMRRPADVDTSSIPFDVFSIPNIKVCIAVWVLGLCESVHFLNFGKLFVGVYLADISRAGLLSLHGSDAQVGFVYVSNLFWCNENFLLKCLNIVHMFATEI